MDRIPDSGSDDWGSTPHGRTTTKTFPGSAYCHSPFFISHMRKKLQAAYRRHTYISVDHNICQWSIDTRLTCITAGKLANELYGGFLRPAGAL